MFSKVEIERNGEKISGFLSPKNHLEVINWMAKNLGDNKAQEFNQQLIKINQLAILENSKFNENLINEFLDYCLTFNIQTILVAVKPQEVKEYQKLGFENIASGLEVVLMAWG
jgi:hypothetical protein